MSCDEVRRDNVTERYALDRLDEGDRERFERHYLACDTCFRELQVHMDLRDVLTGAATHPSTETSGGGRRRRGTAWLLLAASIFLALGLTWVLRQRGTPVTEPIPDETSIAELARVSPPEYTPPALRGLEGPAMQRFLEAMEHYVRKDFAAAIPLLEEATRLDPEDPGPEFFLGISFLMTDQSAPAIESLRRTVGLGDTPYLEEAHFYLAKAYLGEGNVASATEELKKIVEMRGDLEEAAADLLLELQDLDDSLAH
jgi:tetratricopeptide (TPR) repeat protein